MEEKTFDSVETVSLRLKRLEITARELLDEKLELNDDFEIEATDLIESFQKFEEKYKDYKTKSGEESISAAQDERNLIRIASLRSDLTKIETKLQTYRASRLEFLQARSQPSASSPFNEEQPVGARSQMDLIEKENTLAERLKTTRNLINENIESAKNALVTLNDQSETMKRIQNKVVELASEIKIGNKTINDILRLEKATSFLAAFGVTALLSIFIIFKILKAIFGSKKK